MNGTAHLDAVAESAQLHVSRHGLVQINSHESGDWDAVCTRCNAGRGAFGSGASSAWEDLDELNDYEDRMLEDFITDHQNCSRPAAVADDAETAAPATAVLQAGRDDDPVPSPAAVPHELGDRRTVWVVKQASGGDIRVLADWHTTYARPDGTELRFFNHDGADQHRVATVRAGSWHWVCAETALDPREGEQE